MKRILVCLTILFISFFSNAQPTCMGVSNVTSLNLHNGALVAGTANTVGAKYRFSNAATGVDVLVTIVSFAKTGVNAGNFTFITPDAASTFAYSSQAAVGGYDNNFQPFWLAANAYYNTGLTTLEAVFQFELSDASANGTTVIPVYRNLVLASIDNDGSNSASVIQEEVAYSPAATAYTLNSPSNQINVSANTYRGPAVNQPNIGVDPSYISYAYYFNTSSFTWYSRHYFTMNTANTLNESARLSSLGISCSLAPGNNQFPVLNISGNVYNDVNALTDNKVNGNGINSVNALKLNVNLMNSSGTVIASTPVAADGTYAFYDVKNQSSYTLQLSTVAGTVGSAAPSSQLAPNWVNTGETVGNGTGNDGTVDAKIAINVNVANVNNINFGIQRGPESAFNQQPLLGNPAFFFFVPVPDAAFLTNNIGVTASTMDYDGGKVSSIRITSFPTNTNAFRIGGTTYIAGTGVCPPGATCTTWPAAGVVVPYTNGVGVTSPVSVDPIDGSVNIVIDYAAIDDGGLQDPTPGSVSQPLITVLPLKIAAFEVAKQGNTTKLNLSVTEKMPNAAITVERSTNGVNFTAIATLPGSNNLNYTYTDLTPVQNEKNYYRVKITAANGEELYSSIKLVRFTQESRVDVYPVPAGDVLNVSWNQAMNNTVNIQLFSPSGQPVASKQAGATATQASLNTAALPAGYYLLRVTAGNEVLAQQKVIKQ